MTLIVARRTDIGIQVVSDIRATDPLDLKRGYPHAVLKVIVLSPTVAVAFAGGIDLALDALAEAASANPLSHDFVENALAPYSNRGTIPPDFIVVSTLPDRLSLVRAGTVNQGLAVSHIGDDNAFNDFQELSAEFSVDLSPEHEQYRVGATMVSSMRRLVHEGKHKTVGEAFIGLNYVPDGTFRYQPGSTAMTSAAQSIPSGEWTKLRFGTAAEGGHAYSVLVPDTPGIAAVGLHFYQGRLGFLYMPLKSREPFRYANLDHDGFRSTVMADHGFAIQGTMIR